MNSDLVGRTAIITGAGGGIGSAAARALAGAGMRLVLVDRVEARIQALAGELAQGVADPPEALALDVGSEDDMQRMAEVALARFGRIDALVAAAGIARAGGALKRLAETSFDEWRQVIDVNLTGTFLSNRAVLGPMIARGTGDIVNIASTSGRHGRAFDGPYCASKFGVIGLSESLAEEVARLGVRVQTVLPDAVDTSIWEQGGSAALRPRELLAPERVAQLILYLISLPRDTYLLNPALYPLRVRARKKKP